MISEWLLKVGDLFNLLDAHIENRRVPHLVFDSIVSTADNSVEFQDDGGHCPLVGFFLSFVLVSISWQIVFDIIDQLITIN